ncbi:MAG TPA: ABC transporter substrate-binding protein [Burkholderiales bacterium]|nr:ABC transporter substrate-binding protein [Burkholderiales bacterium]
MIIVLALFAALALGAAQAASPPTAPDVLVQSVSTQVIEVLKHDQAAGRSTNVTQLVEEKILPLFDFERMTSMAVARNWRNASPAQRSALIEEFRTLLVRTYSVSLSSYRDEVIDYKPLRGAADAAEAVVRSSVKRPGAETLTIDYDMAHGPSGWKVYDVKVAGVSLVITYRESFAAVVRDAGIDGLIKTLTDKNRPYAPASAAAGK